MFIHWFLSNNCFFIEIFYCRFSGNLFYFLVFLCLWFYKNFFNFLSASQISFLNISSTLVLWRINHLRITDLEDQMWIADKPTLEYARSNSLLFLDCNRKRRGTKSRELNAKLANNVAWHGNSSKCFLNHHWKYRYATDNWDDSF